MTPSRVTSTIACLIAGTMLLVAVGAKQQASEARERAESLRQARVEVALAERRLGGSDIGDALASARAANATAVRVGVVVERIAASLGPTAQTSVDALRAARLGIRNAAVARRQTDVASGILGAIAGYQSSASRYSVITNRALVKILRALRKTNEEFP